MYLDKDIIKEGNPILREKAKEVKIPLNNHDLLCLEQLFQYLIISENDELAKQYNIRPGVGIAAPQVGESLRMFAMSCVDFLDENQTKYAYAVINPKIVEASTEMTYLPDGEGCLSVVRDTIEYVVPRHYQIKFKAYVYDFFTKKTKFITKTLKGYPAIVFQHEYDHLDGILYVDKMLHKDETSAIPLYTVKNDE